MRIRINDRKIQKAVRADAKARGCSEAKAVVMALGFHYTTPQLPRLSLPASTPTWNGSPSRKHFDQAVKDGRVIGPIVSDGFGHITYCYR